MSIQPSVAPAGSAIRYRYAYASDRGLVREQNEDAVAVAEEAGLALVADGMGGYNAGEIASGLAAEFLVTHLADDLVRLRSGALPVTEIATSRILHALLRVRIDGANEAIIDLAAREPECQGMGTTLAMLLFHDEGATTLHLGDSRVYRMRDEVLSLLTRDHSLLQEQLDAGVLTPGEARTSISRNFVTRALGVDVVAEPEINEYDLIAGDLYLLCSDGLPDMLSDEEIFDLLQNDGEPQADVALASGGFVAEAGLLDDVARRLVDAANARGGRDNVSVVLASVGWARPGDGHDAGPEDDNAPDDRERRDRRNA